MVFRKLFSSLGGDSGPKVPHGKSGARAYAIGDVHGCLAQLDRLIGRIEADLDARPVKEAFLIFVGDLIDRGPDSAGVIERLRTYSRPGLKPIFLTGNHEEYFLRVLAGERGVLDNWLDYGGKRCAESYGVSADQLVALPEDQALALLRRQVPDGHRRFLKSFGDTFRFGDYLFVHAGIRPGLPLEQQSRADLRWIREPFLQDSGDHGFVVVHGHTIVESVEELPNRIGIDTGAYRSGVLTALVIDGPERCFLSAGATEEQSSDRLPRGVARVGS
ncbi:MAG: metallophosphoesterase family protein [Allosphingosinicella sp.]|uniref:metallophosphoesterase family protein n=1 Tax=Allosphingosinicella sp. TaxID=2823234 RepID=UPI00393604E5